MKINEQQCEASIGFLLCAERWFPPRSRLPVARTADILLPDVESSHQCGVVASILHNFCDGAANPTGGVVRLADLVPKASRNSCPK